MSEIIDINTLQPGPRHHRRFDTDILEIIDRIRIVFQDVYLKTLDEWVDGFDRDAHPEREIALWSHMADVFERAMKQLPPESKNDVLVVLLVYSSGFKTKEEIRSHTDGDRPLALSDEQIDMVIKEWTL